MAAFCCLCSAKSIIFFILLSAIPIAYIIRSETTDHGGHAYHSRGWMRECAKWDDLNRRFIVSFIDGGLGVLEPKNGAVLEEAQVVGNAGFGRNSTLGLAVDGERNRVVAVIADVLGNKYSAVAAYDLSTWDRLFLTHLTGPGTKALADDVAVDPQGNAYITDTKGSKVWKVGPNGQYLYSIESPLFAPKQWYLNIVGLNGIVHHPNGYLLVVHTSTGNLFKIDIANGDNVKVVSMEGGALRFGDGLELLSPTKLVVAGNPSRLVESLDNFESAKVVGKFVSGAAHRLVTAATVKDGKVYLNHVFGLGYPKRKHLLGEARFVAAT